MVLGQEAGLLLPAWEAREHERGADEDREDAGAVGEVRAVEEGALRGRHDLGGIRGICLRDRRRVAMPGIEDNRVTLKQLLIPLAAEAPQAEADAAIAKARQARGEIRTCDDVETVAGRYDAPGSGSLGTLISVLGWIFWGFIMAGLLVVALILHWLAGKREQQAPGRQVV